MAPVLAVFLLLFPFFLFLLSADASFNGDYKRFDRPEEEKLSLKSTFAMRNDT
jgi:hypothetical protein